MNREMCGEVCVVNFVIWFIACLILVKYYKNIMVFVHYMEPCQTS